jgi:dipeptide transport system ATP-binding protein
MMSTRRLLQRLDRSPSSEGGAAATPATSLEAVDPVLVRIEDLRVEFGAVANPVVAVEGVDLTIESGEVVGLVGESGSGKSVTALALMNLVDYPGRVHAKFMAFAGRDLLEASAEARRMLAGRGIAMIFQDPLTSLDPCYTVGFQLDEALKLHGSADERSNAGVRRARALELLREVEIADPAARLRAYPHQLSGGMAQRVMIAIALAGRPQLLIADEPTTALDVTVQAQVLALLMRLRQQHAMAVLLITHDLAVVAETADRVVVLYAGQVMETGRVPEIFEAPRHPYTRALLDALPEHNLERGRLRTIPGVVPGVFDRPSGCLLAPRCAFAQPRCVDERPALSGTVARAVRCHFPL